MNWKYHIIIAAVVSAIFGVFTHVQYSWYQLTPIIITQFIIITVLSGLVADLDHENGKLHNILIGFGLTLAILGIAAYLLSISLIPEIGIYWLYPLIIGIVLAAASFFMGEFAHHRGWIHSIPACILYSIIILILTNLDWQLSILGFIGSYSHLIADGIPFKTK